MNASLPAVLWCLYAAPAYLLAPLFFRLRYGFSPVKESFPPRTVYQWMDALLGVTLVAYSAWLLFGSPHDPARALSITGGVACWTAGCVLRAWTVYTLGPSWRIGQDDRDDRAVFVASGPYRYMRHPINTALVIVTIGQALMTGPGASAMLMLAVSLIYLVVQGIAEDRYWSTRRAPASTTR
jgi:protein-S-isoprenylcysteine O-methyltransferase Ste14